ncbi:XapX domain-containing protein [Texcoconibacillus texcoconensis]|uniref:XapX domain-containing protein n=1 Tax=Texcoconibacillus texcoconensis TaxID=1095777 RepID=A0A840QRM8_9BACI|nr:DUF1427 family protein [Texcoconibacillus texcoconensis]MBB5174122.1 XapX domain-containing protein [Texcoconibacillus texcoconensis]
MQESILAVLAGLIVGIIFGVIRLPVPAPPAFPGIMGILGIYLGYIHLAPQIAQWFGK